MNGSENNELLQDAVQGRLTPQQRARFEERLAADHNLRAAFEEEKALEQLLGALPDVPVSSNFTARVLAASRQDYAGAAERQGKKSRWSWGLRPAFGLALVALAAGGLVWEQQQRESREAMAESLTHFSAVASTVAEVAGDSEGAPEVRPVSVFQDFQAIQQLAYMPGEQEQDLELYLALHK